MIVECHVSQLEEKCRERGYSMEEVMPCVVLHNANGGISVDVDHPSYPRRSRIPQPGTALKKLLAAWPIEITDDPHCECLSRAAEMDTNERETPGWCKDNIDTIVGWLREQASQRGLPFVDSAGKFLVNRAIAKSYREAAIAKRSSLPNSQ
jgi:hypothetical protein